MSGCGTVSRAAPATAGGRKGLTAALRRGYRSGVACLLHPAEREREALAREVARLAAGLPGAAAPLEAFLEDPEAWSEELYLATLELSPAVPPYLGTHLFDEPGSCRGAARSDRNPYMVELRGIYRHFGWELEGGELPDYLPLMADFLRLTLNVEGRRDLSIRRYFLEELLRPGLGPLERALEERKSPYALPVRALRRVVERDAERQRNVPRWSPPEGERRQAPTCGKRLAGVPGAGENGGAGGDGGAAPGPVAGPGGSGRTTGGEG